MFYVCAIIDIFSLFINLDDYNENIAKITIYTVGWPRLKLNCVTKLSRFSSLSDSEKIGRMYFFKEALQPICPLLTVLITQ